MKTTSILRSFLLLLVFVAPTVTSCEERKEGTSHRRSPSYKGATDYFTITDLKMAYSDFLNTETELNEKGLHIVAQWKDKRLDHVAPERVDETFLTLELHGPEAPIQSPTDEYKRDAYKTIIETRVDPIRQAYYQYCEDTQKWKTVQYLNIYTRALPSIVADKPLFGRDAGKELGDLFLVSWYDYEAKFLSVVRQSNSYKLLIYDNQEEVPFDEYYGVGTLMRPVEKWKTQTFPAELFSYDSVTLTLTFPVVIDHVWEYALSYAKYGESAQERFTDTDLTLHVRLSL